MYRPAPAKPTVGTLRRTVCLLTYRAGVGATHNVPMENVTYGITALRYAGTNVVGAMMGLFDISRRKWDLNPTPARLTEVVDRMVEGDIVISMFPDDAGGLEPGPEIKVDVLAEGTETLALDDEGAGRSLLDLPRF